MPFSNCGVCVYFLVGLTQLAIFVVETSGFPVNVLAVHLRKNPCFASNPIQLRKSYLGLSPNHIMRSKLFFIVLAERFFLMFFGILLAVFLLEAGMRFYEFFTREAKPMPGAALYAANSRGDTLHGVNLDIVQKSGEQEKMVHLLTNSEGFIGRDYPVEKPADTERFAFLGDSLVEAVQVGTEDNFTWLLEKRMNEDSGAKKKYEFMNFAVGGEGTMEELLIYENYVKKYKPDYVFLFFFSNDFENNQFYLPYREMLSKNDPQWKNIRQSNANNNVARTDIKFKLLKSSRLLSYMDVLVRGNAFLEKWAVRIGLHHAGVMGVARNGIHPGFFIFENPLSKPQKSVYDFTGDLLALFAREAAENGSKFVLVYLPTAMQVDEGLWLEQQKLVPDLMNHKWNLNQPQEFLKNVAAQNNMPFLDLTPAFGASYKREPDEYLYNGRLGHFNEKGHRLVVQQLQEYLSENNILGLTHRRETWR